MSKLTDYKFHHPQMERYNKSLSWIKVNDNFDLLTGHSRFLFLIFVDQTLELLVFKLCFIKYQPRE